METAGYITIAIFMAGVIYGAGRLTARVDAHAERLTRLERALDSIHGAIRELKNLVTNGAAS